MVDLYLRYMPQFLPGIAPDIPKQASGEALPVFGYAENDSVIVVRDPDSPALAVIQRELFKIIGIDADESYFLRNVFRLMKCIVINQQCSHGIELPVDDFSVSGVTHELLNGIVPVLNGIEDSMAVMLS